MTGAASTIVIDTNVLLDWLVFDDRCTAWLALAIRNGSVIWIATAPMLQELSDVLSRTLPSRWEDARKRALTLDVKGQCKIWVDTVPDLSTTLRCSDPADQMFIDLAIASGSAWLITRDHALLGLHRRALAQGVAILRPAIWAAAQPSERPRI